MILKWTQERILEAIEKPGMAMGMRLVQGDLAAEADGPGLLDP